MPLTQIDAAPKQPHRRLRDIGYLLTAVCFCMAIGLLIYGNNRMAFANLVVGLGAAAGTWVMRRRSKRPSTGHF